MPSFPVVKPNKPSPVTRERGTPIYMPKISPSTGQIEGYMMTDVSGTKFVSPNTPEAAKAHNFSVPVPALRVRPSGANTNIDFNNGFNNGFDPLNDGFRRPNVTSTVSTFQPSIERGEVKNASTKTLGEFKKTMGSTFDPKSDYHHFNLSLMVDKQPTLTREAWEQAGAPKVKLAPSDAALAVGKTVGGVAGGVAGGAIGTALLPGVGTVAGKVVGAKLGEFVGEEFVKNPEGIARAAMRFGPLGAGGVAIFDKVKELKSKDKAPEALVARVKSEKADVDAAQLDVNRSRGASTPTRTLQTLNPLGVAQDTVTNVKGNLPNVIQGKGVDVDPEILPLDPVGSAGKFAGGSVGSAVGSTALIAAVTPVLGPLAPVMAPVAGLVGGSVGEAVGGRAGVQVAETALGPDNDATKLAEQKLEVQKMEHSAIARQLEEFDTSPDIF